MNQVLLKVSYTLVFCYFVIQFLKFDNKGFYQIREETYKKIDNEISNFFTEEKKGNIFQFRDIDYLHTYGGVNSRILDYDQFKEKYKQDPLIECDSNPNYFSDLSYKYNLKYIVISKTNLNLSNLDKCIKTYNEINIGQEFNNRNKIYENSVDYGTFYSNNEVLDYYKFQNFFYKINIKDKEEIFSNVFFHPSWVAFEKKESGIEKINDITKNDVDSISISNFSIKSEFVYLVFFPQILFYTGLLLSIITLLFILKSNYSLKK